MNLVDVAKKRAKMCLVAPPKAGGQIMHADLSYRATAIRSRSSGASTVAIPHRGVQSGIVRRMRCGVVSAGYSHYRFLWKHPSGDSVVISDVNAANPTECLRAALLRTARLIMRGEFSSPLIDAKG